MEYLTRPDIRTLSNLCKGGFYECKAVLADPDASGVEKAFAEHQMNYYAHLLEKLDRIGASDAKRIEITRT